MNVTFIHGGNNMSLPFAGRTISEVTQNPTLREVLNLSGRETVEIRGFDETDWTVAASTDVLEEGDVVRFTRQTGTKG